MEISEKLSLFSLLSLFLFFCPILKGQTTSIFGKCFFKNSLEVIDSVKIVLIDTQGNTIKTVFSNKKGIYKLSEVESGTYQIFASNPMVQSLTVNGIFVGSQDFETIDLSLTESCQKTFSSNVCPYCMRNRKVLKIAPGTIRSLNFGDDRSNYKKYEKKIRRKGFESYLNHKGEEIVISMFLEKEREKFNSFCYHWFCKRCKKVF